MAYVKHTAIHTTPKAHLKYILNPDKNEEMKYVTGICCRDDLETAYDNFKEIFAPYLGEGDLLICLSTSGNSKNAVAAAKVAKALGVKTLALTGAKESKLSEICDVCIKAPEAETFKVQELHLPIYHYLCANLEDRLFHK